jgi:CheY-like chemotaxis protein
MGVPYLLVVDDDPDQRSGIAEVLETQGYVVATAANGWQAIELAARRSPALILLDLDMPVMSGWDVLRALGRDATLARIPVIVVSGEADLPRGIAALAKPFRVEELLQRVRRTVGEDVLSRPSLAS